jgi:class 3 adenylate cyclase/tetratricopeptide (TPR) repeat protein
MKCPNCQTMNPAGAKFCVECGKGFDIRCPKCDTITPAGGKFCMSCGHRLQRLPEPQAIDYSKPQTYTPRFLAEKILTSRSSIEGERKLVTVFFADVANFTALSEKLDPEEVHHLMDGTFKILMENIHRYEGTINQFTGDGVMALFGAPVAHEDHALRACHAALAIQQTLKKFSADFKNNYAIDFAMRIGLNSGPVVVGSIGDDLRMDYTAIGNTTNLASRMETLAKPGSILVSTATHRLVRDYFQLESIGIVDIKGLEKPHEAYRLLKTGDVGTRIGASVAKGLTRFVGRKNSMAVLMDVYKKMRTGSGQVVGLVGEAGVGKSRLLLEFVHLLAPDESIYLEGRCLHYGSTMSYLPVLDIIRSYFGIKTNDSDLIIRTKLANRLDQLNTNLKPSLAAFQEVLGIKSDQDAFSSLDPQHKRERTFEAIRDLFLRISQDHPLIIAVEDLHWIDGTSEDFLDYLLGWLANSKIMLLLLYRPEYTHHWGSKSFYTQIGLTQLRAASSTELLEAILAGSEIAPEIRDLILARASGNPLFIEEFTRTLLENGTMKCDGRCYVLNRQVAQIDVPDTIQGLIAARIDRLEENIKRTMQVASVIGRDFAYRILQSITGLQDELKAYLLNLQVLEFIYEKTLFPELEYIFKHALIQEVTYYSLLAARRKELHRKVGQAMEKHFADRLNEHSNIIGEHFLRAEDWERAYIYLHMAGENAIRLYALAEAKSHCNKAIKALDHLEDSRENRRRRVDTIIRLTISSWLADPAEALFKRLDEAAKLVQSLSAQDPRFEEDSLRLARVHFWIGRAHYKRGDMREALAYYNKVLPVAQQSGDKELLAIPSGAIGQTLGVQGHLEKGAALLAQAIKLFEQSSRWPEWIQAKSFYGSALVGMGAYQKGLVEVRDALNKARDFQSFTGIAVSQNCLGFAHFFAGDRRQAVEAARAAVEAAKRSGDLIYIYVGYALWGWAAALVGQLEVAADRINRSREVAQKMGDKVIMDDVFQAARAEIALLSGSPQDAIQIAGRNIETAQPLGSIWSVGVSHRVWGQALAKLPTPSWDQAEIQMAQSIEILESGQNRLEAARTRLAWGEICRNRGNTGTALNHWEQANRQFTASNAACEMQRVQSLMASH